MSFCFQCLLQKKLCLNIQLQCWCGNTSSLSSLGQVVVPAHLMGHYHHEEEGLQEQRLSERKESEEAC